MNNFRVFGSLGLALFWALSALYLIGTDYEKDVPGCLILAGIFLFIGMTTDEREHKPLYPDK